MSPDLLVEVDGSTVHMSVALAECELHSSADLAGFGEPGAQS